MNKNKFLLLFLLLCTAAPLIGAEFYDEKKVSSLEIIVDSAEESRVDSRPILARMKTQEGDTFSQTTFDSDLKTLSEEYEYVEPNVKLQDGELAITIRVTPRPSIHEIQWVGNEQVSTSTLQKELDIKTSSIFNRQTFNKGFNKVKEYYFKKGYFESQISYSIQPIPSSNEIDIRIDIQEGRPGRIEKIVLNGFTNDEKSDIEEQMYLKKYNFLLSWITGSGTYRDEILEQDKMTILNYLHNKGYADARVDIQLDEDTLSGKLIIEITAHRGQLFHFGLVKFSGNTLLPTSDLIKKSLIKEGTPFSPEKIRETGQAIKDLYGQRGYIDASVQHETLLKENEPIFDVDFYIDEGQEYKVGLVHIFGNTSTHYNVILRESLLVPGETFDCRKLKATQSKLEAIGYFKSVNVYAVRSADDDEEESSYRDVYIEVEETTTGNISLFMGFSSTDSIFGGLDLTERNFNIRGIPKALFGSFSNLRGGGEFFHIKGTVGKSQNNVLVQWMNPYVYDTLWRFGVDLSYTWSELQDNVLVRTYGGSVYANYPLSTFWTAGVRERLRHAQDSLSIHPVDKSALAQASVQSVREQLNQDGLISAFGGNISYDSTDNAIKPHNGWRSYAEADFAGIGGKYQFLKLSYLNSIYWTPWKRGTFKLRGDLKFIVPYGHTDKYTVPYSERFFLGGVETVRGYEPFTLGPVVKLQGAEGGFVRTDTPYGGLSSALVGLEYNFEVFRMLDVFTFLDVGCVEFNTFKLSKIRPSTGVGLRVDIGNRTPIIVGFGYPLVKKDRDSREWIDRNGIRQKSQSKWQKWFFSMGGQF